MTQTKTTQKDLTQHTEDKTLGFILLVPVVVGLAAIVISVITKGF